MIAAYIPGTSLLHRAPTGLKLAVFCVLAVAIALVVTDGWRLGGAVVLVAAIVVIARLSGRWTARTVYGLRWAMVFMLVPQLIFIPGDAALVNTGRVALVLILAAVLTATTTTSAMLDAITTAARPLRRIIDPDAIGLLVTITLSLVPLIATFATTVREAQRARGIRPGLRTFAVPLLVLSTKHADDVADALAARGIV